jgi:hypothetical protein
VLKWLRHGVALASPLHCTPLFPRHTCQLSNFHPRSRTGPPSLSFLFSLVCRSHASLSSESHPVLSPLSPLKARVGGCTMAMWFPTSCSTGDFPPRHLRFFVRYATTSVHQSINATLFASPSSHPQIRSRARRIALLRQHSGGRSLGAVGKEVVGGRAMRSSRCLQI